MRFLIAFVAILGVAAAGRISPVAYADNAGDAQAAVINANVAASDYARNIVEKQALREEDELRNRNAAVRRTNDAGRDIRDSTYWAGVVASQNNLAAAQSQAAAIDGAAAGARAAFQTAQLSSIAPIAPIAPIARVAPIASVAPLAYAGYGAHGIAPIAPLAYAGYGAHGIAPYVL